MKKRFIIFYVATFCIIAGLSFAIPASSAILFYEDFEDALKLEKEWHIVGGHGSQGLTTEQIRCGSKSYKFSLTCHEYGKDYREELSLWDYFIPGQHNSNFIIGDEYWIGFSIFLADGYHSPKSDYVVHHQYHGVPDEHEPARNPVLAISTKNGEWISDSKQDSRKYTPCGHAGCYEGAEQDFYGAFSTGQWYDFVINIKWSYRADGFLKIWKNKVLVTDRTGPNCFNDDKGPFLKFGIYGDLDQGQTITIYYDELRIGDSSSSYSEVAPGEDVKLLPPTSLRIISD